MNRPPPAKEPDRGKTELYLAMEETRQEIGRDLAAIRDEMGELLNWRRWVGQHPFPPLAASLALGFLIGRGSAPVTRRGHGSTWSQLLVTTASAMTRDLLRDGLSFLIKRWWRTRPPR